MRDPGTYPAPVAVRTSPARALALAVATLPFVAAAAYLVMTGVATLPIILGLALFGAGALYLLVLAVRRPVAVRLTSDALQYRRLSCPWEQVLGVQPYRVAGAGPLLFVLVQFAAEPTTATARAELRTIYIPSMMVMSRRRLATLITDYQNAWAADHRRPALPAQPGRRRTPARTPAVGPDIASTKGTAWHDVQAGAFQLRVPAEWALSLGDPYQQPMTATGPDRTGLSPTLGLTRQYVHDDLEAWSRATVAAHGQDGFQLLDEVPDRIDGRPAVRRLSAAALDGHSVTRLEWAWLGTGVGNTLTAMCQSADFRDLEAVFDEAAHSLSGEGRTADGGADA